VKSGKSEANLDHCRQEPAATAYLRGSLMLTYFARHTWKMDIDEPTRQRLWD
jgi:hypothetical protein